MTSEQWQLAKELYGVVSALTTQERQLFWRTAEADDEVRAMVERMLSHRSQMQDFLTHSPLPDKTAEPNAVTQAVGRKIGAYILKRKLGTGGMGVVYLGVRDDDTFAKDVAIKLLWRGFPDDEARFQRERKILAQLTHPHIAQLLDGGITPEGWQYIVMEYVAGLPITEYCEQHQLTVSERVQLLQAVCAAVQYAHQNLVIHRDLKPGNILVTRDGVVKLLDFGIAKLVTPESEGDLLSSLPGNWMMTPEYASPEQLAEQQVSTISDVYSLGVVLYELLTGERPYQFPTRSPLEAARRIAEAPPPLPSLRHTARNPKEQRRSLRGDLDNIALKALQYEPGQRYTSVSQLRDDLTRYLQGQPVLARKPTVLYLTNRFLRRHKYTVLMGAMALLILSAWLGSTFWQMADERTQARLQRRKLYAAQMQQTLQSWQEEDFLRTKKIVGQWLPHDDEEDLRGFEWHYLQQLINPSELTAAILGLENKASVVSLTDATQL